MKKLFLIATFSVILILFLGVNTPTAKAATVEELQAQIKALSAQITQLQQQLAEIQGETVWCYDFNVNLRVEMQGAKVRALQTALQKQGFAIPVSETEKEGYFGDFTASAVVQFQEKYASEILTPLGLTHGTGYVGPATRAKLNNIYGCGVVVSKKPYFQIEISGRIAVAPYNFVYQTESYNFVGKVSNAPIKEQVRFYLQGPDGTMKYNGEVAGTTDDYGYFSYNTHNQIPNNTQIGTYTAWIVVGNILSNKVTIDVRPIVPQPSIIVISPNGGERWEIGKTYEIKWTTQNTTWPYIISINLWKSGYGYVRTLFTNLANDGIERWTISSDLTPGNDYKINIEARPASGCPPISGVPCSSAIGTSDALFSIVAAGTPSITVLSPNGGEKWEIGKTYPIKWESKGAINGVILYLTDEAGRVFLTNLVNVDGNLGTANWQIPSYISLINYKILIHACSAVNCIVNNVKSTETSIASDMSDAPFSIVSPTTSCTDSDGGKNYYTKGATDDGITIGDDVCDFTILKERYCDAQSKFATEPYVCPNGCENGACRKSITVLSPNGTETWMIGSTYTIKWKQNGLDNVNINIELGGYTQDGTPIGRWYGIANNIMAKQGYYDWTIPSNISGYFATSPSSYKIRLVNYKDVIVIDSTTIPGDESDNYFSIVAATTTCTDSDGGRDYYTKGTATYTGSGTPAQGYTQLTDFCAGGGGIDIRTLREAYCSVDGYVLSENYICPNGCSNGACIKTITVVSPNGGEIWPTGTMQIIKWTPSSSGTVRLEIRKGALPYVMISSCCVPDTGSYTWPVPTGFALANDYRVRVTKNDGAGPYDESDGSFSIASGGLGMENIENQLASISKIVSELMARIKELTK